MRSLQGKRRVDIEVNSGKVKSFGFATKTDWRKKLLNKKRYEIRNTDNKK